MFLNPSNNWMQRLTGGRNPNLIRKPRMPASSAMPKPPNRIGNPPRPGGISRGGLAPLMGKGKSSLFSNLGGKMRPGFRY